MTLTAVDKLFNIVLFLIGISFIISVTVHHHLSLIPCLQSPAVLTQPRPSLPMPCRLLLSPTQFWPSCYLPCRPHRSARSLVTHYTKNGLACGARPSSEDFTLHRTTASGPVLCHPSRPLGIIPAVPRGAPGRFRTLESAIEFWRSPACSSMGIDCVGTYPIPACS